MASQSFSFPQNLLHSATEPQWLPRPPEARESRLDALEREQAAYIEKLRKQVLPTAPDPIGVAGKPEDGKTNVSEKPPEVDLKALPVTPLFWSKHRAAVDSLTSKREGKSARPAPVYTGRHSLESMDSATSSFSLSTPTSRTG